MPDLWADLYLSHPNLLLHILGSATVLPELNIILHLWLLGPHEIHVFTHARARSLF